MKRALIDWDFAASGIWIINSPIDDAPGPAESPRGRWGSTPSGATQSSQRDWESFYRDGRRLAEATQSELGGEWQVLWAADGAWHFVRFP